MANDRPRSLKANTAFRSKNEEVIQVLIEKYPSPNKLSHLPPQRDESWGERMFAFVTM